MSLTNKSTSITRVDEPVANKLKCPKFKLSRTLNRNDSVDDVFPEVKTEIKKPVVDGTSSTNNNKNVAYLVVGAVVAFSTLVSFTVYALKRT